MGMDIYGINPVSETGKYFRNNVWWYRPLAEYIKQISPNLAAKIEYLDSNDGDGLKTKADCLLLAENLRSAVVKKIPFDRPAELSKHDSHGEYYPFSYENVLEFCNFLENCGDGFEIW